MTTARVWITHPATINAALVGVAIVGVAVGVACLVAYHGAVLTTPALLTLALAGSVTITSTLPRRRRPVADLDRMQPLPRRPAPTPVVRVGHPPHRAGQRVRGMRWVPVGGPGTHRHQPPARTSCHGARSGTHRHHPPVQLPAVARDVAYRPGRAYITVH